jgi:hypothetical protein
MNWMEKNENNKHFSSNFLNKNKIYFLGKYVRKSIMGKYILLLRGRRVFRNGVAGLAGRGGLEFSTMNLESRNHEATGRGHQGSQESTNGHPEHPHRKQFSHSPSFLIF